MSTICLTFHRPKKLSPATSVLGKNKPVCSRNVYILSSNVKDGCTYLLRKRGNFKNVFTKLVFVLCPDMYKSRYSI